MDSKTTVSELKSIVAQFVQERDWEQFHNPKDLSMDISVEAGELMEHFLWVANSESLKAFESNRVEVEQELVDVLLALLAFSNACNIDLTSSFKRKMEKNRAKYPVEKARGKYTKYTKL